MNLADYFPIFIQAVLAVGIGFVVIIASHLFGQRGKTNRIQDTPYECGQVAEGKVHPRFSVKFYVIAMLFILFDIEIVFLIPWALIYRDFLANNITIFLPIMFFLGVLTVALAYEVKKGAIDWEK